MTKAQVATFLTRYGKVADDYLVEMRKGGDEKKADALAKTVTEIKVLIKAGKLAEAQSAIDTMQRSLR